MCPIIIPNWPIYALADMRIMFTFVKYAETMKKYILILLSALCCFINARAISGTSPAPVYWFNYGVDDSRKTVFEIFRDSGGRTWIGSNNGLYLFTGYDTYPCTFADGYELHAQIYAMVEAEGRIYVGTNDGLYAVDTATLHIESVRWNDSPREIRSMAYHDGRLWLGALSGLYFYHPDSDSFEGPVEGLPHKAVYSLLPVPDGSIYIGTYNGFCRYTRAGGFETIPISIPALQPNLFVNTICRNSNNGVLYLGTESGLIRYTPSTGAASTVDICNGYSVKSLCIVPGKVLLAGTDNGLFIFSPDGSSRLMRHDSRSVSSIMSNVVWSLMADSEGNVWAGTESGISIADPDSPVQIYSIADLTGSGEGQDVSTILRDSHGNLWLGGSNGAIRIDSAGKADWYFAGTKADGLSHSRVREIYEDSKSGIWLATDGGINTYDRKSNSFSKHRLTDSTHRSMANWVYAILEEPTDSTLWAAGYLGGIFIESLDHFRNEGQNHTADRLINSANGLPNDYIGNMVRDSRGNKWIFNFRDSAITRVDGSSGAIDRLSLRSRTGSDPVALCTDADGRVWAGFYGGVTAYSPDGTPLDSLFRFPADSDMSVRTMAAVEADIWIATQNAVWSLDPAKGTMTMLPLPEKEYSVIYYDKETGKALLGAADVIVAAEPGRLMAEKRDERIDILRVLDRGNIVTTDTDADSGNLKIRLGSDNRDITIDIGTASFSPGEYLRFRWRLDDTDWHLLDDGDNKIRLTSLTPGKHTVEITVSGERRSPVRVDIEVSQPWYLTAWAICAYIIGAIAIASVLTIRSSRRHERKIEDLERRNALATVRHRLFFLSNISHELKTPLSMIIGPLSKLRTMPMPDNEKSDVETAYSNAMKLNTLIHQTVEIDRLEAAPDDMLIFSRIDVVDFCRGIFEAYRKSWPGRNFVFTAGESHIYVRTDAVKLESLINNLLSNAVKYSGDNASISCSVHRSENGYDIDISDDGVGIPADEQQLVFQRLYRSPRTAADCEGTGIGLYLVKQYVHLLGGEIVLESEPGRGTTFRLSFPTDESSDVSDTSDQSDRSDPASAAADKRKRVLVVDDNKPIADFIASLLSADYNVATASNGKAALARAASFRPDIVIADEMMPVMTGLEMSRSMRHNPATASIPILLLTAKDEPGMECESIDSGVDAFMAKPFEAPVLTAKVRQLLGSAERMRQTELFDRSTRSDDSTIEESVQEKQFAAVTDLIEAELSNPDLNVDFVCRTLGMSSKTLYRLIKKLVGVSPVDYIRQTRLRKAAMLLEQGKFSVSEVMYMVGFSSSSYFSKCFAAMFGCTPGQYTSRR